MNLMTPPPYPTGETTTRALAFMLGELHRWCEQRLSELEPESQEMIRTQVPVNEPPDAETLQACSIWQNYRTLRTLRSIRIGWDWAVRELGPGHPEFALSVGKLVINGRTAIRHAPTMASDFRAYRKRQIDAFNAYMRQVNGDGDQQTS